MVVVVGGLILLQKGEKIGKAVTQWRLLEADFLFPGLLPASGGKELCKLRTLFEW